jgi:hypothetical protein
MAMSSSDIRPVRPSSDDAQKTGLIDRLRYVIWGKQPEPQPGPPVQSQLPASAAVKKQLAWKQIDGSDGDEPEFLGHIRGLLERSPSLQASRINVIGLKRVKERFGAEWARVADRADRIARNVIERHLAPGDVYAKWGEDTFITVFARLSENEAHIKCFLIGNEIVRTLLGDEGSEHIEIKTAVTRLDGSIQLEEIAAMDNLFESAEAVDPMASPPLGYGPGDDAPSSKPVDPGLTLVPIERERPAPKPISGERPASHPKIDAERSDILAGVDFVFRPTWDPTRNVLSTYFCIPQVRLSDLDGGAGDANLAVEGDADATARLDNATIARVKQELRAMAADRRRLIIALPIHFETLTSAAVRRRLAAEIAAVAEPMKQYLVIEILSVPSGVLKARLMEMISLLRLHCRAIAVRVAVETIDFTQIHGTGISAVGADIASITKPEFILMQQLSRFQRAAEKAEVVTFLHGAQSRSLVAAAVGAGFHYINGDAVASAVSRPERIVPFQLADLFMPR